MPSYRFTFFPGGRQPPVHIAPCHDNAQAIEHAMGLLRIWPDASHVEIRSRTWSVELSSPHFTGREAG